MLSSVIRNIAILAHVDAGKTTLSERILFTAGCVMHPGDVDDGLATLDYLPEEKAKGITIEAGVETFIWKEIQFNLLDTPGHIDFGIEVDMALATVDTAVLVISAISGVESQTRSAWEKLKNKKIRTYLFINKIDHPSSRLEEVLLEIEERLEVRPVLLNYKELFADVMLDIVSPVRISKDVQGKETQVDRLNDFPTAIINWRKEALEACSTASDTVLAKILDSQEVSPKELIPALKALFDNGDCVGTYCGSALQCLGVRQLMTGLTLFSEATQKKDFKKILATVIRIRHTRQGEEYALCQVHHDLSVSKWPSTCEFRRIHAELLEPMESVRSGDIVALIWSGQAVLELGTQIGMDGRSVGISQEISDQLSGHGLPLLHTKLECVSSADYSTVQKSLSLLARNDPSIHLLDDPQTGGWILQTVGEVQLEVLLDRMKRESGCEVRTGSPEVIYYEMLQRDLAVVKNTFTSPDGQEIYVELQLTKGNSDAVDLQSQVQMEDAIREILWEAFEERILLGVLGKGCLRRVRIQMLKWAVPEKTPIGYQRKVFLDALELSLQTAKIEIFEPVMAMEVEVPQDFAGNLLADLKGRGASIQEIGGNGVIAKIILEIPLKNVFGYSTIGRSISKGTASYALRYAGHRSIQA